MNDTTAKNNPATDDTQKLKPWQFWLCCSPAILFFLYFLVWFYVLFSSPPSITALSLPFGGNLTLEVEGTSSPNFHVESVSGTIQSNSEMLGFQTTAGRLGSVSPFDTRGRRIIKVPVEMGISKNPICLVADEYEGTLLMQLETKCFAIFSRTIKYQMSLTIPCPPGSKLKNRP